MGKPINRDINSFSSNIANYGGCEGASEKPSNFLLMMLEKSEKHGIREDEGKQSDKLIGLEGT